MPSIDNNLASVDDPYLLRTSTYITNVHYERTSRTYITNTRQAIYLRYERKTRTGRFEMRIRMKIQRRQTLSIRASSRVNVSSDTAADSKIFVSRARV